MPNQKKDFFEAMNGQNRHMMIHNRVDKSTLQFHYRLQSGKILLLEHQMDLECMHNTVSLM